MIHTLLGLEADATRGVLKIAPVETGLWRRIEVNGLHFGGQRLDFSVDGGRVKVGVVPHGMRVEIGA
jgi:hypothetical protein